MEKEIEKLRNDIKYYNNKYYNEDISLISDYQYDMLLRKLQTLEEVYPEFIDENSPTINVGGDAKFSPITHKYKLESLQDVFSKEELFDFFERVNKKTENNEYVLEKKIDGLSVSLEYENGIFVRGATRGDGLIGEDVTENLKTIKELPLILKNAPESLVVRGEVYMKRSIFNEINKLRNENSEKPLANERNAAAGSLRQLDKAVTNTRKLSIFCFNIQNDIGSKTHIENLTLLENLGFPVSPDYQIVNIDNIYDAIMDIDNRRDDYDYMIDGAVIKINDLKTRELLGSTSKFPRWAAAYKYPPDEKTSELLDIIISIGRTGVLTPNAVLKPVNIAGTVVSRATLHNMEYINEKDIKIGDTVIIRKAGDIIPEIVSVKFKADDRKSFIMPNMCPECGSIVTKNDADAGIYCINVNCPAQIIKKIIHFNSRDAMNIDGVGESNVKLLLSNNLIKDFADLYYLDIQDIKKLERMGEKSASNMINAIENSKNNDLSRLIFALGIKQVGSRASKSLAKHFVNIDNLINANIEDITLIDDIGSISAKNIVDYFNNDNNIKIIDKLKKAGVNMSSAQLIQKDILKDLIFVCTGTLKTFSRREIYDIIEKMGGKISSSVSKKTNFVIAGDDAGSKLSRASDLAVNIITEEQFREMIKEN